MYAGQMRNGSCAAFGDPAIVIAAASTLGEPLFGRFAATYHAIESMLPRASFYRETFALFEALHCFKSGDREEFETGMARYICTRRIASSMSNPAALA